MNEKQFWNRKRILITGVTGFIGSWAAVWALSHGAEVIGIYRGNLKKNSNFSLCGLQERMILEKGEITDSFFLANICEKYQPDVILHLAGQAIISEANQFVDQANDINVMGTLNVLNCVEQCECIKAAGFVTSIKCYQTQSFSSPYEKSKGCADILIDCYQRKLSQKKLINVLLNNVIGGGDWGKNRLVVDCIQCLEKNETIALKSPSVVISWNTIQDVLFTIFSSLESEMTEQNSRGAKRYIQTKTDHEYRVCDIAEIILKYFQKGNVEPYEVTEFVKNVVNPQLDDNFYPVFIDSEYGIEHAIQDAVEWYRGYHSDDMYDLCCRQIKKYEQMLKKA